MARLAAILSFGDHAGTQAPDPERQRAAAAAEGEFDSDDDGAESDGSFEFAFAPPLTAHGAPSAPAPADDIFARGRILPAYPVFSFSPDHHGPSASSATAPPSPDTYCAWAPRSAPGSPARERAFPKSASTGQKTVTATAPARFRLRDLLGSNGRSHSDGKEKFLFIQPKPSTLSSSSATAPGDKPKMKPAAPAKKKTDPSSLTAQQKKKKQHGGNGDGKKKAPVTEMDMATAHRLFYSKPGGPQQHTQALPYRTGIVGFFAAAHALRRPQHSHPY